VGLALRANLTLLFYDFVSAAVRAIGLCHLHRPVQILLKQKQTTNGNLSERKVKTLRYFFDIVATVKH